MKALIGLALGFLLLQAVPTSAQDEAPQSAGAVMQLGGPRLQIAGDIVDCAFTPDKRGLIIVHKAADKDLSNVILFDAATGLQRTHLDIHEAAKVVVARDKPLMAVVTMHTFEVWDLVANKRVRQWPRPDPWWKGSIAISPDGSQVVVTSRYMDPTPILRFDVATGETLPRLLTRPECTVSFSPDSRRIFAVSAAFRANDAPPVWGKVTTWDAATGKKVAELEHRHDYAALAPDGLTVALGSASKKIHIVDLDSQETRTTLDAFHVDFVFTPDSKQLLIAVPNSPHCLWDIAAKKEVRVFDGLALYGLMPRISPDGRFVASFGRHGYRRVQIWDMASGKLGPLPQGHPGTVTCLAFAPDGRQLASCSEGMLMIFDLKSGSELRRLIAHQTSIEQIIYAPNGKLLASAASDGVVGIWDPATGESRQTLRVNGGVKSLAFSRDGATLVTVGNNRTIQRWDLKKGTVVRSIPTADELPIPLLTATGDLACFIDAGAPGEEGQAANVLLRVLDIDTGMVRLPIANQPMAAGTADQRPLNGSSTWAAASSSDGRLIATSDFLPPIGKTRRVLADDSQTTRVVCLWEAASRRAILRFTDNSTLTRLIAISPDGRVLAHGVGADASATDQQLVLSDIFGGKSNASRKVGGHFGRINCLAFSTDSQYLATGGADQGIFVWLVKDYLPPRDADGEKKDAESYWPILADPEAGRAYGAIGRLERRPTEAVALLRRHLKPVPRIDDKAIAAYVRDLESASYNIRQMAYNALERAGDKAALHVREALSQNPTLEAKRRLELLAEKLKDPAADLNQLRGYRCVLLLERIGTADARRLLEDWSRGAPHAWLTIEASHSLRRYSKVDR